MERENKFRNALRWSMATAAITPRESDTAVRPFFFPAAENVFTALFTSNLSKNSSGCFLHAASRLCGISKIVESLRGVYALQKPLVALHEANYDRFRLLSFTFYRIKSP